MEELNLNLIALTLEGLSKATRSYIALQRIINSIISLEVLIMQDKNITENDVLKDEIEGLYHDLSLDDKSLVDKLQTLLLSLRTSDFKEWSKICKFYNNITVPKRFIKKANKPQQIIEYQSTTLVLADWLRNYGRPSWWSVDGDDTDLTEAISFPTDVDTLAAALENRFRKPLTIYGPPCLQRNDEYISCTDINQMTYLDPIGCRVLQLSWGDGKVWLLIEDKETQSYIDENVK